MYYVLTHGYSTGVILTHLLTLQVNVYISVFAPIFLMHQYDPARITPIFRVMYFKRLWTDQVIRKMTEVCIHNIIERFSYCLYFYHLRNKANLSDTYILQITVFTNSRWILHKQRYNNYEDEKARKFLLLFFSIIYGMKQTYLMHIFKDFDRDDCNFSITIEYYNCIIYLPSHRCNKFDVKLNP